MHFTSFGNVEWKPSGFCGKADGGFVVRRQVWEPLTQMLMDSGADYREDLHLCRLGWCAWVLKPGRKEMREDVWLCLEIRWVHLNWAGVDHPDCILIYLRTSEYLCPKILLSIQTLYCWLAVNQHPRPFKAGISSSSSLCSFCSSHNQSSGNVYRTELLTRKKGSEPG